MYLISKPLVVFLKFLAMGRFIDIETSLYRLTPFPKINQTI
ncbi:hypothetical protein THERMOT_1063 [Bathymodiolus thermophilus thioautotrophic gill symbiont]|nr:hypothetical protein THERMOT_1063 [Bathymodiolus thermophilus thioautotrophic gill symbiont]